MFLIRSFLTFRSTTFIYFHFKFPSAGRSFMLEFLLWSFKIHLIRCFPKASVLLVICCSDFVFQERSAFLTDPEGRSVSFVDLGSWSDLLDADWYHDGFFQTTAGVRSDRAVSSFWTFSVLLISSADSVYFCAFVLFWLEIRLITIFPFAFGSPPEVLLFRYLLFVPIRYHGISNFSRRNVSQMQTSVFVQATDFDRAGAFCHWLEIRAVIW